MNIRKSVSALGFALVLVAPLGALAEGIWENTNDEAGTRIISPTYGVPYLSATPTDVTPLVHGTISKDGQYVWQSQASEWELRPMQYRIENGRLVHVDDPVGHMHRVADSSPLTAAGRAALERSGGS